MCIGDFYNKISNALLTYDFVLKPEDHIKFVICDKFVQGAYQPSKNQVSSPRGDNHFCLCV